MPQLIILDRDGVINEDRDDFVKSVSEFMPIPGSIDAIASLHKAGYRVAMATNQSGVARGLFTQDTLNAMHEKLNTLLEAKGGKINYLALCPHGPDDDCACRKPKPGLLTEICNALHIAPEYALFIGDSFRDYEAAQALGMPFALVKTGKGLRTLAAYPKLKDEIPVYPSLSDAAQHLIFWAHPTRYRNFVTFF